jgi:transposase InsO family protein
MAMPWKDKSVMDERVGFIARLRDGESMTELCREFGISRKTGYKFHRRFVAEGPVGLGDLSRKPRHLPRATDPKLVRLIVKAKEKRPKWGAGKLLVLLKRDHPGVVFPTRSTTHLILERHGLVKTPRKRPPYKAKGTSLSTTSSPNELWCADFKGQFRLGDRSYCYPLTITDHFSRYFLACDAYDSTKAGPVFSSFEAAFEQYGLPLAIRTDNGVPFASNALFGISRLSAWWMRHGIKVERIRPGHPQENGRHERLHRTMKEDDAVAKPQASLLKQQDALELFRDDYNERRPHAALDNKTPADVYVRSPRTYSATPPEPAYEGFDRVHRVTRCGSVFICNSTERVFLSVALGHQPVAVKEDEEDLWRVQFMDLNLGYYDRHNGVFHRGDC